jgi:hypothetical protein
MRWFPRAAVLLGTALLVQGCFLIDRPPPERAPLDKIWEDWMLSGKSGHWVNGSELPWPMAMADRIASSPNGARLTKYAIRVEFRGQYGQGSWILTGGLIGRADLGNATVELFGKEIVREHWPGQVKLDEDYRYDFYLVVRQRSTGHASVVRRWVFPPEQVALAVKPETAARIRELAPSEEEAVKRIKQQRSHYLVAARLQIDPAGPTAIVTILGMVQPMEERADLSSALRQ